MAGWSGVIVVAESRRCLSANTAPTVAPTIALSANAAGTAKLRHPMRRQPVSRDAHTNAAMIGTKPAKDAVRQARDINRSRAFRALTGPLWRPHSGHLVALSSGTSKPERS